MCGIWCPAIIARMEEVQDDGGGREREREKGGGMFLCTQFKELL